jgi:Brp/Blh family beta-carotene 15,15'-monooxygenase
MTKEIFIFIASLLVIVPIVFTSGDITVSNQLAMSLPLILLLGIPHGAVDNVLYMRNNRITNFKFISLYLIIIAINVILWVTIPNVAYILFLVISSYHFGQSQFSHYFNKQPLFFMVFYLFWGISILSSLIYLNINEINNITNKYDDFAVFQTIHHEESIRYIFLVSTVSTLFFLIGLTLKKVIKLEILIMELLVLALIFICFKLMPLLVGFTFYFAVLHSFKVLREEYFFLNSVKEVSSLIGFIKLIAPFTFLSILGIAFLFGLIFLDILQLSYGYCLLIIISSITLPHVFVMNRFYDLLFSINFYKRLS